MDLTPVAPPPPTVVRQLVLGATLDDNNALSILRGNAFVLSTIIESSDKDFEDTIRQIVDEWANLEPV